MIKPTERFVVDIGRKCNLNCKFCYHGHLGDLREQTFKPLPELKTEIDQGVSRGNKYVDFTGGEPTIYRHMAELLTYAKVQGLKTCVITNGLMNCTELFPFVDDFLVSIHGIESVHDFVCQHPGARKRQLEFLNNLDGRIPYRFNTVLNSTNQDTLRDCVHDLVEASFKPYIWNFINFNPHYEWATDLEKAKTIVADLGIVGTILDEDIIPYLEDNQIGVNLRYYPMCAIKEKYRRCVCNDLHVTFDPYEWDYCIYPKTYEAHMAWGISASQNTERKAYPCSACQLKLVCGGVNEAFYRSNDAFRTTFKPETGQTGPVYNPFHYRGSNVLAGGR